MRRSVLLFIKWPEAGKVKTRLAATLGGEEAARIYQRLVDAVLSIVPRDLEVVILFDPPERRADIKRWLRPRCPGAVFRPQGSGDLGERLTQGFQEAFASGSAHVAAIGSDCIELVLSIFADAWAALETTECVVGPSEDGGYYLIALREPCPTLFEGISWSTATVLRQTLDRASATGLRVALLPQLHDVDDEADWRRAERLLGGSATERRIG